jgi:hypothetical protein
MMKIRIGKVLPLLALSIAMSEAGAAGEPVMGAPVSTPRPTMAASLAEPSRYPNTRHDLLVSHQFGLLGTSGIGSRRPGADLRPVPPVGVAKTSALVLSSLGMFSAIALLRLNRTL